MVTMVAVRSWTKPSRAKEIGCARIAAFSSSIRIPGLRFISIAPQLGEGVGHGNIPLTSDYLNTVLIIIDTLQMIRGCGCDNTYANNYRDLSALRKFADRHGIATPPIHHLRKEAAGGVFSRISGTAAISGTVGSSFTLAEDKRGSGSGH